MLAYWITEWMMLVPAEWRVLAWNLVEAALWFLGIFDLCCYG